MELGGAGEEGSRNKPGGSHGLWGFLTHYILALTLQKSIHIRTQPIHPDRPMWLLCSGMSWDPTALYMGPRGAIVVLRVHSRAQSRDWGALQKPLNTVCLCPGCPGGEAGLQYTSDSAPCNLDSIYANRDPGIAPSASRSSDVAIEYSSSRKPKTEPSPACTPSMALL